MVAHGVSRGFQCMSRIQAPAGAKENPGHRRGHVTRCSSQFFRPSRGWGLRERPRHPGRALALAPGATIFRPCGTAESLAGRGPGQRRAFAADAESKLDKQLESIGQLCRSLCIEDDAFMKLALDGALDVAKTRLAWMKRLRVHFDEH